MVCWRVKKSIGYDNRQMLAAAIQQNIWYIDVYHVSTTEVIEEDENVRRIPALFKKSTFQSGGEIEPGGFANHDIHVEFWVWAPISDEQRSINRVEKAELEIFSATRAAELWWILRNKQKSFDWILAVTDQLGLHQ